MRDKRGLLKYWKDDDDEDIQRGDPRFLPIVLSRYGLSCFQLDGQVQDDIDRAKEQAKKLTVSAIAKLGEDNQWKKKVTRLEFIFRQ